MVKWLIQELTTNTGQSCVVWVGLPLHWKARPGLPQNSYREWCMTQGSLHHQWSTCINYLMGSTWHWILNISDGNISIKRFNLCRLYETSNPKWSSPPSLCCGSDAKSCLTSTPWTVAHQASLSFTISQSLLKLTSIASVMLSNHLILCRPLLLLLSILPSIRVF